MGSDHHKFTNDIPMKPRPQKEAPAEYKIWYQKWLADPHYFQDLLVQNKALATHILQFFPEARNTYEDFLQMIFYLRRYDPTLKKSEYACLNVHNTTLLDRFFMLMLKLKSYQQLQAIIVNRQQMEVLFLQLMKLFIPHPRKGFINKLCKFIGLKDVKETTLKHYSACLRQFFPHIQKHIKDYYTLKFINMEQNGYLLRNFKSQILIEDAVFLSMKIPQIMNQSTCLLYEPRAFGGSFHSIQKGIIGYTGSWLLIIQHAQKDEQGKTHIYHFGAFQSGPIRDVSNYQGDIRGFLFQTEPKLKIMSPEKGNGGNHFFYISNPDEKLSNKIRKGIGFGGDNNKQHWKLWIDQDLDKSTVYNGVDSTYGFGAVLNPSTSKLNIIKMQIWGLGNEIDLQNQRKYWQQRNTEIQKRRKVNKSQFLKGDAGLILQNTFAHRQQVYGQIDFKKDFSQKKQSHQEPKREDKH